jgi:hypothetical protein
MKTNEETSLNQHLFDMGIKNVYPHSDDSPSTSELIRSASRKVEFFGISPGTFVKVEGLRELLLEKVSGNVSFKLLVLDPNSSHLDLKARDEGDNPEVWKADIIQNSTKILNMLDKGDEMKLQLKFYDFFPIWRCFFIDDKVGYLTYYPHGHGTRTSPLLVLENKESSLYDPFHHFFDSIWKSGYTPDPSLV